MLVKVKVNGARKEARSIVGLFLRATVPPQRIVLYSMVFKSDVNRIIQKFKKSITKKRLFFTQFHLNFELSRQAVLKRKYHISNRYELQKWSLSRINDNTIEDLAALFYKVYLVQKFRLENDQDLKAVLLDPAIQKEPDFDLLAKYVKYVPKLAKIKIPTSPPPDSQANKKKLKKPKKKRRKTKPPNEVVVANKKIEALSEQLLKSRVQIENPFSPTDLEALCYSLIDEIATEI